MYQPIYCTINDGIGTRSSHSCRGRVNGVNFWANSEFGEVCNVHVRSDGCLPKKDEYEAKEKIKLWTEKDNAKKVKEWQLKLSEREKYNKLQEAEESVSLSIRLHGCPKLKMIDLDGCDISVADLEVIREIVNRKMMKDVKKMLIAHKCADEI